MADIMNLPFAVLKERLADGGVRALEVCEAILKQIGSSDDARASLAWLDEDYARRVAKSRDGYRIQRKALGALHGMPVLIDDSFDMSRVPMKRGFTPLQGALSERDALVIGGLRAAGAQLFAKSTIPTLRVGEGKDGAPNLIAGRHFPLAVTLDARGEVLRAAALKGVFGYRPSAGLVPTSGVLDVSPSLDGVTLLAAELGALAALGNVLTGYDPHDATSLPQPKPGLEAALEAPPLIAPTIGLLTDGRETADAAAGELAQALQDRAFEAPMPELFAEASLQSDRVVKAEGAKCLKAFERRFPDALPEDIADWIAEGEAVSAVDYLRAMDWISVLRAGMAEIFERCNVAAMVGPISGEEARVPAEVLASFLGMPALTLPILESPEGSPLGLTLLAKPNEDARLMQMAGWLLKTLNGDAP